MLRRSGTVLFVCQFIAAVLASASAGKENPVPFVTNCWYDWANDWEHFTKWVAAAQDRGAEEADGHGPPAGRSVLPDLRQSGMPLRPPTGRTATLIPPRGARAGRAGAARPWVPGRSAQWHRRRGENRKIGTVTYFWSGAGGRGLPCREAAASRAVGPTGPIGQQRRAPTEAAGADRSPVKAARAVARAREAAARGRGRAGGDWDGGVHVVICANAEITHRNDKADRDGHPPARGPRRARWSRAAIGK